MSRTDKCLLCSPRIRACKCLRCREVEGRAPRVPLGTAGRDSACSGFELWKGIHLWDGSGCFGPLGALQE